MHASLRKRDKINNAGLKEGASRNNPKHFNFKLDAREIFYIVK